MTEIISNNSSDLPPSVTPVVLLLLDGWGIAPASEANAIFATKTPTLSSLIKEYPLALLASHGKTLNARYLSLGAGSDLDDENTVPAVSLVKVLSDKSLPQLKITETERFAALTHFFNGHKEKRFMYEDWKIVSSEASDHSLKPSLAMSRICRELIKSLKTDKYNFIVASIPTLDLVASSGDFKTVKKAAEDIDKNLRKIVSTVLGKKAILIISAACGNAESLKNMATELPDTEMTDNPVPLIIVGEEFKGKTIGLSEPLNDDLSLLAPAGNLGDLAPTILDIMNIEKPEGMTGNSLIDKN
ncbi:MAG: hypothetical protein WCN88_02130 [Candidatus Falkowbacteria bacterium]